MKQKTRKTISSIILMLIAVNFSYAQNSKPVPDLANVKYGEHERNVFDIWFADTTKTTPLAIYIHGGGFVAGSKEKLKANDLSQLLKAGISVASINYRYLTIAPLPAAHNDAKQALQFIRSKAKEWKIDKDKVAAFGSSAGAQISMWLAFSDDMANPESKNPIERESTRLTCVATNIGQTTNDVDFRKALAKKHLKDRYNTEFIKKYFGDKMERKRITVFGAKTIEEANETAKRLSAMSLVSADDPPIFMTYFMSPDAKAPDNPKKIKGWLIHHVDYGIILKDKMDKLNIEADLKYRGAETKYESLVEFFVDKLLSPPGAFASKMDGTWNASFGSVQMTAKYKVSGEKISGTINLIKRGNQMINKIENGTVSGNTFEYNYKLRGKAVTHKGKLVNDNEILIESSAGREITLTRVEGADKNYTPTSAEVEKTPKIPSGKRLRDIVEDNFPKGNVYIGATSMSPKRQQILAQEFSYITPANSYKQSYIHPEPGIWRWENPDSWVAFAEKHNQVIRIHGPISPQCSRWAMDDRRTPAELEQNLREFMTALCKRYNGHKNILWMDVINETVNPDGSWKKARPGKGWEMPWEKIGYEKTPAEFKHLGGEIPKYIIQAFRIATEHAPDIKLVINQHLGMEEAAWNKVKDMVLYLRSIGCRVDGVGWQAHIKLSKNSPNKWETGMVDVQDLSDLITWVHANDLEFHVTENNIHVVPEAEGNVDEHAKIFADIVKTLLENRHTGVVTWNLWDIKDTTKKAKVKIGLWDRQLRAKKSYYAVQQLLENPPAVK